MAGQINDTGDRKSRSRLPIEVSVAVRAKERGGTEDEKGGWGKMEVRRRLGPISELPNIDRWLESRAISPHLGAFRDPLIAAITVIIDLLRVAGARARASAREEIASRRVRTGMFRCRRKQDLSDVTR